MRGFGFHDILGREEESIKNCRGTEWKKNSDSVRADGHISGTGMNSLNHYAYGSIAGWLWRGAVGIVPLEEDPGFRRVSICPHMNWKMKYADADYLLMYTGSYPLRETMTNLGYRKEQIEKIDQRLNRVLE